MGTAPELAQASSKTISKAKPTKPAAMAEAADTANIGDADKQAMPAETHDSEPEKEPSDTQNDASVEPDSPAVANEPTDTKAYFATVDDSRDRKSSAEKPGLGDDPATSAAVEDIERQEADVALLDETGPGAPRPTHPVRTVKPKHRRHPMKIMLWAILLLAAAIAAVCFFVPSVRTVILDQLGVRGNILLTTTDGANNMPLERARVELDGKVIETDSDGKAKLTGLGLGSQTLRVSKAGFAPIEKPIEVGVRTTDLGEFVMKPVGAQLTYELTDYLSGKPIKGAVVSAGSSIARSNAAGAAVLTVPTDISSDAQIRVEGDGYRPETTPFSQSKRLNNQRLVSAQKHIYIAKNNGRFVVYKIDVDGANKEVLVDATGDETADSSLMFDPAGKKVAYVSTREGQRNNAGKALQTLVLVDTASGGLETIDKAQQITPIGWKDSTVVYLLRDDTVAASDSKDMQRLQAYDYGANKRLQLGGAGSIGTAILYGNMAYYLQADSNTTSKKTLQQVNINGGDKRVISEQEVAATARNDYKSFIMKTPDRWIGYTFGDTDIHEFTGSPQATCGQYLPSPDGRQTAWVNLRAGDVDALMVRETAGNGEKNLIAQKNIQAVTRWLTNRVLMYRVDSDEETADYALSLDGGKPVKVADVAITSGAATGDTCNLGPK